MHQLPGVVVLAVERDKAAIILEALHLINVLIVAGDSPTNSPVGYFQITRTDLPPVALAEA